MKTKKKVLIGLMALCLAGTVGGALALQKVAATQNLSGTAEKAVYLYWGNGSTTNVTINNIDSLVKDTAQYRFVSVAPKTSTNLAGTVNVNFALAADTDEVGKTAVLTGLTVKVFEVSSSTNDGNVYATVHPASNAPAALLTLNSGSTSGNVSISVTASYTTTHYYAMEFIHDGTPAGDGNVFGGEMTISQSFVAA